MSKENKIIALYRDKKGKPGFFVIHEAADSNTRHMALVGTPSFAMFISPEKILMIDKDQKAFVTDLNSQILDW
jgi:hypothetical protein